MAGWQLNRPNRILPSRRGRCRILGSSLIRPQPKADFAPIRRFSVLQVLYWHRHGRLSRAQRPALALRSLPAASSAAACGRPDDRGGLVRIEWGNCGDARPAGKRVASYDHPGTSGSGLSCRLSAGLPGRSASAGPAQAEPVCRGGCLAGRHRPGGQALLQARSDPSCRAASGGARIIGWRRHGSYRKRCVSLSTVTPCAW